MNTLADVAVLLSLLFAPFGFAWIVGHSTLTRGFREWLWGLQTKGWPRLSPIAVELLECPGCLGFWVGLIGGALYFQSIGLALLCAFATTGVNAVLGYLTGIMSIPSEPPKEPKP